MFTQFAGLAIVSGIINIGVLLFLAWLAYRFVKAHESIAYSLRVMKGKITDLPFEKE
ncbi:hypothetical protein LX73_1345 [Fodinibius salinus]|uniref:Uncharacterized protein n=1 Tax=Fodinibius salinus TaxID=860790 RepID=A0A5D3YL06_9BACT|nr:hypothetical protein [Fodinibius salinus]TYP93636.1 hypothetical protein LX73_1345 [Fodinibius salinus]